MKSKILLLLFALLVVFVLSCEKEKIDYFYLTETQIKMIPYTLGQSVMFLHTDGDSFELNVVSDGIFIEEYNDDGIAPNYSIQIQRRIVRLNSNRKYRKNYEIEMTNSGEGSAITINIFDYFLTGFYHNDEGKFIISDSYNGRQYLLDSIEINSNIYYDVVEHNRIDPDNNNEIVGRLLYNTTYGILQFEHKGIEGFMIDNFSNNNINEKSNFCYFNPDVCTYSGFSGYNCYNQSGYYFL
ncbi:MAG: hypothetical protein FWH18_07890 [Marinilabiliaceae bacterium]|nr:hypothetical protein [Marinilabiliaceae bacterium]